MRIIILIGLIMSMPVVAKEDVTPLDVREVRDCIKVAKDMDRTERSVERLGLRLERMERLMSHSKRNSDTQYANYERMVANMNKMTYFYREKFREYQENCNGVYVEKSVLDKTCRNSTSNTFCDMFK